MDASWDMSSSFDAQETLEARRRSADKPQSWSQNQVKHLELVATGTRETKFLTFSSYPVMGIPY